MRTSRLLIALALTALLTVACGQTDDKTASDNQANNTGSSASGGAEPVKADPGGEAVKLTVNTYVTDEELSELKELTVEIEVAKDTDKYLAAVKTLQQVEEDAGVSLWKHARFLSAELKDGRLTVDMTLPDEARLGAPGELLALEAIEKTAFQFKEVQELDLLVDGVAVDSLMGHTELEHPIVRPS